jgi:hypothetical protein
VLDRLVGDFTLKRWARRPERSVWWPSTWRNFEANGLAVVVARGLAIATAVIMITVWGWITGRVLGRMPPFDDPIRLERAPVTGT